LRENAKKLSVAACESDPVAAISALGDLYQAECQTSGNRVDLSEKTEMAETLMRACRAAGSRAGSSANHLSPLVAAQAIA